MLKMFPKINKKNGISRSNLYLTLKRSPYNKLFYTNNIQTWKDLLGSLNHLMRDSREIIFQ